LADKDLLESGKLEDLLSLLEDYYNSLTNGDMPDEQGICHKVKSGVSFLKELQEKDKNVVHEDKKIYGFSNEKEERLETTKKRILDIIKEDDLGYDEARIVLERTKRHVLEGM
jgi:hypothetical protein